MPEISDNLLRMDAEGNHIPSFGEQIEWTAVQHPKSYYPTRLEYLAGKVLAGLLTGKSLNDWDKAIVASVKLAQDLEKELDKVQK